MSCSRAPLYTHGQSCDSLKRMMPWTVMQVLGWEGFWGTVLMVVIGMPLAWFIPGSDVGELPALCCVIWRGNDQSVWDTCQAPDVTLKHPMTILVAHQLACYFVEPLLFIESSCIAYSWWIWENESSCTLQPYALHARCQGLYQASRGSLSQSHKRVLMQAGMRKTR